MYVYLRKGCASRNAFIRKEKFLAHISKKMKTLKALKESVRCVYGPSRGNEQSFSFTDTWTEENKTGLTVYRKKRYNHLCLLICYPLNPFVVFYAISIFKRFLR